MEKRDVYVMVSGDYCCFDEMTFSVVYDITTDEQFDSYTLNELKNWEDEYSDVEIREAYLIDGEYFVEWN